MLMISVDEVMDILKEYAVCTPDEEKNFIQRINQASMFIDNTHWMPLPTPPESEDDAENSCMKEASEGEWIIHFDDLFPEESTQECSICHAEQYLRYGDDDNYCPNCGAKMKQAGKG